MFNSPNAACIELTSATSGEFYVYYTSPAAIRQFDFDWEETSSLPLERLRRDWVEEPKGWDLAYEVATNFLLRNISWHYLHSFPGEPYDILQPIPIKIECMGEDDFLASFDEVNLSIGGETEQEALQNIIAEILDTFEIFSGEEYRIGPEPAHQLRVMKKYLKPSNGDPNL